ncbi:MAG: NAD(P)-binding domain-containing protein [Bacteroidetes bacterium]|nr:NAD(P)-binding domain-containing protein [Bacteroidota bacterium]
MNTMQLAKYGDDELQSIYGNHIMKQYYPTIIIGGGQAGLATGYHLKQLGEDFIIIDAADSVGDSWRKRWDSLKLFTPPAFNGLPGWEFPSVNQERITKDEMAAYLQKYSVRFQLPVRMGIRVSKLSKSVTGYLISTSQGNLLCDRVVVATGPYQVPKIPSYAKDLDPVIYQVHSSLYRNPDELPAGQTLVVGAATSGIEIGLELSATRHTMIAGKPSFIVPAFALKIGPKFHWWFSNNVLTIKTPIGRKMKSNFRHGGAVFPHVVGLLNSGKMERVPRMTGVENGKPLLEDGRKLNVASIIWCTGYHPDFSWIDMPVTDESGWPIIKRGVSMNSEGLFFVGVPFQFGVTSSLVGGVGRDAAYIAKQVHRHSMMQEK